MCYPILPGTCPTKRNGIGQSGLREKIRPSITINPKPIKAMPRIWLVCNVSPKNKIPNTMAETGTKNVTIDMFVAPALSKILK
jgi:hypothetical protein